MDREAEAYGPLKSAVKAFGAEHERWKALVRQNEGRNRALLAKRNQSLGIPDLGAEAERAARARSEELARKVDDECKAYVKAYALVHGPVKEKDRGLIEKARELLRKAGE